jgi:Fe-S cluster assembly protein SufD
MANLNINETPIRTSKNYGINNIKLENIDIPKTVGSFKSLKITGNTEKFNIENNKIENEIKYGNGDILTKQINEISNNDIQIYIKDKSEESINLNFDFSKENQELIENIFIQCEEATKSTIIIKYSAIDDLKYYHNGQLKILAKKDSQLNIIILNLLNNNSDNFLAIENIIEDNANINYTIVDFGGKNSITNYYTNLQGKKSKNNINTIYLGCEEQLIDLNYIVEVFGEKSNINMNIKGAIKDKAKKHFKGTIDFKKGCKKSTGDENEYCTILSPTAKAIALPMLLCTEEDVEGNHSAAAGKIDNKELFYIMSRGFSKTEAQKLIVRARFNEVLEKIEKEELKDEILEEIDKRLG